MIIVNLQNVYEVNLYESVHKCFDNIVSLQLFVNIVSTTDSILFNSSGKTRNFKLHFIILCFL
jgi:hypothetical protein